MGRPASSRAIAGRIPISSTASAVFFHAAACNVGVLALPISPEIDARLVLHDQRHDSINLGAVRVFPVVLAPRAFLRETNQIGAGDVVMMPDLAAPHAGEKRFGRFEAASAADQSVPDGVHNPEQRPCTRLMAHGIALPSRVRTVGKTSQTEWNQCHACPAKLNRSRSSNAGICQYPAARRCDACACHARACRCRRLPSPR
jgi:hypothetical protein